MSLKGKEIRVLRQRLGWSLAEMARRMGCNTALIENWEAESSKPDSDAVNQLRYLQSYIEIYSQQIQAKPQIEKQMQEQGMSQLTHRDLIKDLQ